MSPPLAAAMAAAAQRAQHAERASAGPSLRPLPVAAVADAPHHVQCVGRRRPLPCTKYTPTHMHTCADLPWLPPTATLTAGAGEGQRPAPMQQQQLRSPAPAAPLAGLPPRGHAHLPWAACRPPPPPPWPPRRAAAAPPRCTAATPWAAGAAQTRPACAPPPTRQPSRRSVSTGAPAAGKNMEGKAGGWVGGFFSPSLCSNMPAASPAGAPMCTSSAARPCAQPTAPLPQRGNQPPPPPPLLQQHVHPRARRLACVTSTASHRISCSRKSQCRSGSAGSSAGRRKARASSARTPAISWPRPSSSSSRCRASSSYILSQVRPRQVTRACCAKGKWAGEAGRWIAPWSSGAWGARCESQCGARDAVGQCPVAGAGAEGVHTAVHRWSCLRARCAAHALLRHPACLHPVQGAAPHSRAPATRGKPGTGRVVRQL